MNNNLLHIMKFRVATIKLQPRFHHRIILIMQLHFCVWEILVSFPEDGENRCASKVSVTSHSKLAGKTSQNDNLCGVLCEILVTRFGNGVLH